MRKSDTGHDLDETERILKTYLPRTMGRAAGAICTMREEREAEKLAASPKSG